MLPLKEMKDYARKVDEGIENLEIRLKEPSEMLNSNTQESTQVANDVINRVIDDLVPMLKDIEEVITVETKNIEDSKNAKTEGEDVLNNIIQEINGLSEYLTQNGIESVSKVLCSSFNSDSSSSRCLSVKKEKFLLDESPIFTSPNYSSTPDSCIASSKERTRFVTTPFSSTDRQLLKDTTNRNESRCFTMYKNVTASSELNKVYKGSKEFYSHSLLQNYLPLPIEPKSSVKKKNQ